MAALFRDVPSASRLAFRTHDDIRGACVQDAVSEWPAAANVVPWRLSRSVSDSVTPRAPSSRKTTNYGRLLLPEADVVGRELSANLVSFRCAQVVVEGESFAPVIARLGWVTGGVMDAGEASVSAGLFELVTGLGGQTEGAGVSAAGLVRLAGGHVCLGQAVEGFGLAESVLVLVGDRLGLLVVVDG